MKGRFKMIQNSDRLRVRTWDTACAICWPRCVPGGCRCFARLVHHCHLVTIRGNSYRMRQHTELWQTLHAAQEPEATSRRRRGRQEVATP
jgi:hypothetical protein